MSRRKVAKKIDRPMKEIGATGLHYNGGRIDEEFLRQLKGTQWLRTLREMSENDEIIGAMLYAMEMLIRRVAWSVERGGTTPQDEEAALFIESIFEDMSHTFRDFISEWMAAPVYGFAPFEVIYKRRLGDSPDPSKRSRYNDGLIGVRKLAIRHPCTLDKWEFDESGGIQAFVQRSAPTYQQVTIPIEKLLLFRVRTRKGSPEGTSLLRNAFIPWFRKKRICELEAIGIERDLNGLPLMYAPAHWFLDGASAGDIALLEEAKKIVRNVKVDAQAGVVLPAVFDENNNRLLEFKLVTTDGRRNFDTGKIVERYDRRIAMTVLADVILLGHEAVGSFALADSKSGLFAAGLESLLDDIQDVFNRHLVPRLLALNGIRLEKPPQYRHGSVEAVDLKTLGEYVRNLSASGIALSPSADGELEKYLLRVGNLPSEGFEVQEVDEPEPELPDPDDVEIDDEEEG